MVYLSENKPCEVTDGWLEGHNTTDSGGHTHVPAKQN